MSWKGLLGACLLIFIAQRTKFSGKKGGRAHLHVPHSEDKELIIERS